MSWPHLSILRDFSELYSDLWGREGGNSRVLSSLEVAAVLVSDAAHYYQQFNECTDVLGEGFEVVYSLWVTTN